MKLIEKIAALQDEIGVLKKDIKNPFYKSKYFDINQLINQLSPILKSKGLVLTQPIIDNKVYSIVTDLESGKSIDSAIELPTLTDPQKIGSCITYYRRYTLASLLALEAEDDDGNKATQPDKPWLNENTPQWDNVVKALGSGKFTIKDIEAKYKISKANKEKLENGK